ncbi:MAG TPA: histidinol-phosphate transaminase, partial [Casimicrobiaceae bacterium]
MNHPSDIASPVHHAPEYVRAIAPYVGGKPIEEVARELDLDPSTIIKLASNENPRGASPKVQAAIAAAAAELTRYPDGNGFALKAALSKRLRVQPEQIVLGNGSN